MALTYNLFFSFAFTIFNMSHTLMVPLSTSNVKQRDGLSLFSNMGYNMIPGSVVSLLFPMVLMPALGVDYDKWVLAMSAIACIALPLIIVEYYFTKERVTEAAAEAGEVKTASLKEQMKACFSSKYWIMLILFVFLFQLMSNIMTVSLPYFCNWVLGTYNDGSTQALLSVVGKAPLGFGVFVLWALVKKFGKRPVMIIGFLMAAAGELLCWFFTHNMSLMLVGSFIYAIGFLPSYVYSALMADTLDYIEYDKGLRCDGLTASLFTIVATISVGIGQGLFNMGIASTGYVRPQVVSTEMIEQGGKLVEKAIYNTQNAATQRFISFAYIGVPLLCLVGMAVIMIFFKVEKLLPKIHQELTARRKAEAEARGEIYISQEEREALEQAENDRLAEENRIAELKAKCEKKGLKFEEEEAKYQAKLAARKAKEAAKHAKKK